ncbi:MAG TPA: SRPBCC family protein [Solirubrobacterales bacterium]|nr:SRPBCC family protein [Solirubrobacterales bacterium]
MARNRVHIHAGPAEVFAVLSDPERYPEWVVGAAGFRDEDDEFPAVGSRFHHKVGSWPIGLKDYTEVLEAEPPDRLVLKAKARPLRRAPRSGTTAGAASSAYAGSEGDSRAK